MSNTGNYVITTDSTCDMPRKYYEDNGISVIDLSYVLSGKTYKDGDGSLSPAEFYRQIREQKAMPSTTQINPDEYLIFFEEILQKGFNILHISFSSALSGSGNNAKLIATDLNETYGEQRVIVVDSLCASMGEGLLLSQAVELKKQGMGWEELARWVEDNKLKVCHYFTVDSLFHLLRGGRVSKASAIVGSVLGIKPILHVDDNGKLIPIDKVRGRKTSVDTLLNYMVEKAAPDYSGPVFISHGDSVEDAKYLAQKIEEKFPVKEFTIHFIGPVIGTHSGPGTLALFFIGSSR